MSTILAVISERIKMVELCELKLVDQNLESQWPADIDQHIAQLDFQRSTDDEDTSLFSSMALDPSMISTDSLDIEELHARCEVCHFSFKFCNFFLLFHFNNSDTLHVI